MHTRVDVAKNPALQPLIVTQKHHTADNVTQQVHVHVHLGSSWRQALCCQAKYRECNFVQ